MRGQYLIFKNFSNFLLPKIKNIFQIFLNPTSSYTISRNSKREFVFNVVSNQSTSFFFFKLMSVVPVIVRAMNLSV